jgi:sugar phosphate isomerase/epimerase
MLGISTCWWHKKGLGGRDLVEEILELGFQGVELEYRIPESRYHEMRSPLKRSLAVLSIHNFFPKPDGLMHQRGGGDRFLMSSTDKEERQEAVRHTIKTLEIARDLGARAVVLHLGRVDMPYEGPYFKDAAGMPEEEGTKPHYSLGELRKIRDERRGPHLDAVLFCLERINDEAGKRGLLIGLENRYHLNEIPDFREIGAILERFQGGYLRYWHDIGHACAQERMGIVQQRELLETYAGMMIGIHLHDIKGIDDHLSPGQGDLDFKTVVPWLQPSTIRIMEIHHSVPRGDLMEGKRLLNALGIR